MTIYRKTLVAGMLMLLAQSSFAHGWQAAAMWDWAINTANPRFDAQQAQIDALQSQVDTLTSQMSVVEANTVLELDGYLGLDTHNLLPVARFEGINVQVRNGFDADTPNGLGNLIVGYDSSRTSGDPMCSVGYATTEFDCSLYGGTWAVIHKQGSHNVVIGEEHNYSQSNGLVVGRLNSIAGLGATVTAGLDNFAAGPYSSVSGGYRNTALDGYTSVSGGSNNTASGYIASVSGGGSNTASGSNSSVSGGSFNTATGYMSSISAGYNNSTAYENASVSGGRDNAASGPYSSVSGGRDNVASDHYSSVSGGYLNEASGEASSVSGGYNRDALNQYDWRAGSLVESN